MATRRIRRYKRKYQVDPTTLRAKVLLPQMYPRLELALADLASLEADCYAVLESLEVPSELWGYYEAFYYRAAELGLSYWDATFRAELQLLINEFVARGLSEDVLEALVDKLIPWLMAKRSIGKTIVNGGFETGDFTGWEIGYEDIGSEFPFITDREPHSGLYCCQFPESGYNWIAQYVNIPVECVRELSFWKYGTHYYSPPVGSRTLIVIFYTDGTTTEVKHETSFKEDHVWVKIDLTPFLEPGKTIKRIKIKRNENWGGYVQRVDDVSVVGTGLC